MKIEHKIKKIYSLIGSSEKTVFLSSFISGMIAHLYVYSNTIPNFDGISRMYDEQQMTISGRWFLHYVSGLNSYTQMPMVIGVLAMFFLALSGVLMIRMFQIESKLLAGLWGILFVVFPAVADTNAYTYTSSAYCIAIFLAILGTWMAKEYKWGFLGGAILLALSMGIYQTYVTVAITLAVLLVFQELLLNQSKIRDMLIKGIKYIIYLGLGALLYYIILKLFLYTKKLTLWSYLGMNDVEKGYPIDKIGNTFYKTYLQVWNFCFKGEKGLDSKVFITVNIVIVIISLVLIIKTINERKIWKDKIKLMCGILLIALIPISINFVQVVSPYFEPRLIMKFSFVFIYFIPIILLNMTEQSSIRQKIWNTTTVVFAGGILVLSVYFWQYDNVLYAMLNQAHRATLSFVTNVVSRIESCEGYQMGMKVVIVGGFPSERYDTDISIYEKVKHESALSSSVIPLNKHIYYYMNDWLNVPIEEPTEDDFIKISDSETFKEMALYPDDGSVRIVDEFVVVKMKETFVPKSLYEKEYEKRR